MKPEALQTMVVKAASAPGTDRFPFEPGSVTSFHVFSPVSGAAGRRRRVVIFSWTVNLLLHRSRFRTLTPVDEASC